MSGEILVTDIINNDTAAPYFRALESKFQNPEISRKIVSDIYDDDTSSKYRDLVKTKNYLVELGSEEQRIIEDGSFKRWYDHRKVTIETLQELHDKINNLWVGANVVRGVGAVAGLASAFAGIVGLVLEAKGHHESAESFNKFRNYSGLAGGAALCSSTIVEYGLSQNFMMDVERILKKDMGTDKTSRGMGKVLRRRGLTF